MEVDKTLLCPISINLIIQARSSWSSFPAVLSLLSPPASAPGRAHGQGGVIADGIGHDEDVAAGEADRIIAPAPILPVDAPVPLTRRYVGAMTLVGATDLRSGKVFFC